MQNVHGTILLQSIFNYPVHAATLNTRKPIAKIRSTGEACGKWHDLFQCNRSHPQYLGLKGGGECMSSIHYYDYNNTSLVRNSIVLTFWILFFFYYFTGTCCSNKYAKWSALVQNIVLIVPGLSNGTK